MEKKKETKKQVKKATKKTTVKKVTAKEKTNKKKKGFTLIELLAVIIILGILMIIAIPSVTKYISDSRKSAYIDTAKEIISGARTLVNEGKLGMYDTNTTYYIPQSCIQTENASKSPYGDFTKAYVGVVYNGSGYKYYWISVDDAGQGVANITPLDKLESDSIKSDLKDSDIEDTVTSTGIGNRSEIKILNCSNNSWDRQYHIDDTSNNTSEDGEKPDTYYLYVVEEAPVNIGSSITPLDEPNNYLVSYVIRNYHYEDTFVLYDNYQDAINSKSFSIYDDVHYPFFIRIKVENNTVVQTDIGYKINNQVYYLKGLDPSSYSSNQSTMLNSFGSDKCYINIDAEYDIDETECSINRSEGFPGIDITLSKDGTIDVFDTTGSDYSWQCSIWYDETICLQPF